jgi:hypothetical protein
VRPIQVNNPFEYHEIPQSLKAVASLCRAGFVCPVVTVQSRIGKGGALYRKAAEDLDIEPWCRPTLRSSVSTTR